MPVFGRHAAERARITDPHQMQCDVSLQLVVIVQQLPQSTPESTSPLNTIAVSCRSLGRRWRYRRRCPAAALGDVFDLQPSFEPSPNSFSKTLP